MMINLDESKNLSETSEDYLKAIYDLAEEGAATTSRLAERLGVAPATVTSMLKRLADQGWVDYRPYRGVTLTPAGREEALRLLRSHRLAETFLVEVLGLPWDQVHAEAHRWEHVISAAVLERLDALLGHPAYDPHGDPIPSSGGDLPEMATRRLLDVEPGSVARVERVDTQASDLLHYLGDLGLKPGVTVRVISVEPYGGPFTIEVGGTRHAIGREVADRVLVHLDTAQNTNVYDE